MSLDISGKELLVGLRASEGAPARQPQRNECGRVDESST